MTTPLATEMGLPETGAYSDPQRNGLRAQDLLDGLVEHLLYSLGRPAQKADRHDIYMALSYAVRDRLRGTDPFFVLADFSDYLRAQSAIDACWADPGRWHRMALLNTARSGFFSSDQAIGEYARTIWNVAPSPVSLRG
jgi:glucan phosphorylase